MRERNLTHTFDGYAKLLRWRIKGGNATLRARFLQSTFYEESKKKGDVCPSRLFGGTVPPSPHLAGVMSSCNDNYNVNVFQLGEQVLALSDFEGAASVDLETLTTKKFTWNDTITAQKKMDRIAAAHPARRHDDEPGVAFNFVMRINPLAVMGIGDHHMIVYRVDDSGKRHVIRSINLKRLPYIHSVTVTKNYVIIHAPPLFWELSSLMVNAKPVMDSMRWDTRASSLIYVVAIDGSTLTQFEVNSITLTLLPKTLHYI